METITISREEYEKLKIKEKIADDPIIQLTKSLEDLRKGKIKRSLLQAI